MSANESFRSSSEQLDGSATSPSGQQMSKQTLLALSAIPKPKLTDNESWIKKKPEMMNRDYSKHWLHQVCKYFVFFHQVKNEHDRLLSLLSFYSLVATLAQPFLIFIA